MTGPSEHRAETAEWQKRYTLVADWDFWQIWEGDRPVADFLLEPDADRIIDDHRRAAKADGLAKALVSDCWYCKRGYPLGPTHIVKTAEQWAERAGTEWKNMNTGGKSFDEFYPDGVEDDCDLNDEQRAALAEWAEP